MNDIISFEKAFDGECPSSYKMERMVA
jgi:hypothetical protein